MKRTVCKAILIFGFAVSMGASDLFARGRGGGGGGHFGGGHSGGGHIGGGHIGGGHVGGGHIGGGHVGGGHPIGVGGHPGGMIGGVHAPSGAGSIGGHSGGAVRLPSAGHPSGAEQLHSQQGLIHPGTAGTKVSGAGSVRGIGAQGSGTNRVGAVGQGLNTSSVNNQNVNAGRNSFQSYNHPQYYGHWGGHYGGWSGYGYGTGSGLGMNLSYGGYGWGNRYGGYSYPYGWVLGYPLGWGLGAWGMGALGYYSGYLGYYNPYYLAGYGSYGNYSYAQPIPVTYSSAADATGAGNASPCDETLNGAIAAFKQNNYDLALDLMNNGIVQCPDDSVMHEFRALVLFARGDYQQAASTIHSVLAVGPGWNWTTLSGLYGNAPAQTDRLRIGSVPVYTAQLRSLEAFIRMHPQDAASRFLLAYHYIVAGYPEIAVTLLQQVVKLAPNDRVAADVLRMISKPAPGPSTAPGEPPTPAPPEAPASTEASTSAEAPVVAPIASATLLGTWQAARSDGSQYEMTLTKDSTFHWKFTLTGNVQEFGGTYKLEGNILSLERKEGGSLIAGLVLDGNEKFNFKMVGAPPEDPGLNFSK